MFGFWLSLALWALVGGLGGVALWLTVPWLTAQLLGPDYEDRVAQWYLWAAQTLTVRGGVIVRDEELQLVRKRWDDAYSADVDTASGTKRRHYDYFGELDRLKGRIFGFGLSQWDSWVSPLLADIGEVAWRQQQQDEIGPQRTEGGWAFLDGVAVDKTSRLVDLSASQHLIQGDASPEDGQAAEERAKKSQSPFAQTVTPAQGLLLLGAFVGPLALVLFMADGNGGETVPENATVVSLLTIVAASRADRAAAWLDDAVSRLEAWVGRGGDTSPDADPDRHGPGKLFAAVVVGLSLIVLPAIAWLTYGLTFALVTAAVQGVVAVGVPVGVWLLGGSLPAFVAMPAAKVAWILAMLAVDGRGVIVERDSGTLEFRKLRDGATERFEAVLSDGKELPIAGEAGDLYRFAWGELGLTAEKTERNMGHLTIDDALERGDVEADGGYIRPNNTRGGYRPFIRTTGSGQWTVTLPHLETWCRNSSKAKAIRIGREKALTEAGGGDGLGQLAFLALLVVMPIAGSLMGWLMI